MHPRWFSWDYLKFKMEEGEVGDLISLSTQKGSPNATKHHSCVVSTNQAKRVEEDKKRGVPLLRSVSVELIWHAWVQGTSTHISIRKGLFISFNLTYPSRAVRYV